MKWTIKNECTNALDFSKDGEIKLQLIRDEDLTDEDLALAKKVLEVLNKCDV